MTQQQAIMAAEAAGFSSTKVDEKIGIDKP